MRATNGTPASGRWWLGATAIMIVGATLRVLASLDDWRDEIWSLSQVRRAGGALAVLRIAHDNSHPLNSLDLDLIGDGAPSLVYRLLAIGLAVLHRATG